jgi:uncharacterized protein (TIGR02271 family)
MGEIRRDDKKTVLPVMEEVINVDKEIVAADKVQISKNVDTEEVTVNIPTLHEEVQIERVSLNQYVTEAPAIRQEGNTTIIPVLEEVIVKRLLLVEELHVTKVQKEVSTPKKEILRKEKVIVSRVENSSNDSNNQ